MILKLEKYDFKENFVFRLSRTKMVMIQLCPASTLAENLPALLFTELTVLEPILFWIWSSSAELVL